MNKLKISLFILLAAFSLVSCVKNEEAIFTGGVIEFDAATWNANAVGVNYPILTRVPPFARAVSTTVDSTLNKTRGVIKIRVNLVGPQRNTPTEITYQVLPTVTTAVAGTHYTALPGTLTIPANASFADIDLQLLNTATAPPATVDLVLELRSGTNVSVNPNYNRVGLRIAQ
ncbi:MAG: DUF4843 domain-containing protein [Chitinophagaceae bacterium]